MSYFASCSLWTFIFLLSTSFCFSWPLMPNSTHLSSVPFCLPVIPLLLRQLPSPVVIRSIHYLNCFDTSLASCSLCYVNCCFMSHVSWHHWKFYLLSSPFLMLVLLDLLLDYLDLVPWTLNLFFITCSLPISNKISFCLNCWMKQEELLQQKSASCKYYWTHTWF